MTIKWIATWPAEPCPAPLARLRARLVAGTARVGVVGLGRAGLPLAVAAARAGLTVVGVDPAPGRVEALAWGLSCEPEVAAEDVAEAVGTGRLDAVPDPAGVAAPDVLVLAPDQPPAGGPADLVAALAAAGPWLRPGQLIGVRAASGPGATMRELAPRLAAVGLRPEADVLLAYLGDAVGGVGPASHAGARAFLDRVGLPAADARDATTAELAAAHAATVRAVNAALADELAALAGRMAIDARGALAVLASGAAAPAGVPAWPAGGRLAAAADAHVRDLPARWLAAIRARLAAGGVAPAGAAIVILGAGRWPAATAALVRGLRGDGATVAWHADGPRRGEATDPAPALGPVTRATLAAADLGVLAAGSAPSAAPGDLTPRRLLTL